MQLTDSRQKMLVEYLWMPLLVASCFWGGITFLRRVLYPYLWRYRSRIPVICVGNIHSGGSGKTPLVMEVANHFNDRRPIIVSRGYGGRRSRTGAKVSLDTENGAAEYGDEPWLLANRLKIPVYIGRRRAEVLRVVEALEDSRLIVMDDGFQHLAVHRDIDILVINVEKDLSLRHTIPLGELREPLRSIGRAHCVCLVGDATHSESHEEWKSFLGARFPALPQFHLSRRLMDFTDETREPVAVPLDQVGYAFCGIGSPSSFQNILSPWPNIKWGRSFPDHQVYASEDIDLVVEEAYQSGAKFLITTEKDWAKVEGSLRAKGQRLLMARMQYEVPGDFWTFLRKRLE